jgi:hypothetical protein
MDEENTVQEPSYTKEQMIRSKRFAGQRDLLEALLSNDESYTCKQADAILQGFLKGKVN